LIYLFFKKIGKDLDDIEMATCIYCKKKKILPSEKNPRSRHNYGVSYLIRHVCCCKTILSNLNRLEKLFDMTEINQKTHCSLLAEAIVAQDLPFSFVQYDQI